MLPVALIYLSALVLCQGRIIQQSCKENVLRSNLNTPYQLALDYDTNTLFFSESRVVEDSTDSFVSVFINLKTNELNTISGIPGGFANAVDDRRHIVYLGGSEGVYKYNYDKKTAELVTAEDTNIWQMFFKDKLYFTTFPNEELYFYENGKTEKVPEFIGTRVTLFAVDKNDNMYYSNSTSLFTFQKKTKAVTSLGSFTVNGITSDINGQLYFSTPTDIYRIEDNGDITKIFSSKDLIYGVAVESDGTVLYADDHSIIRLTPPGAVCDVGNDKKNEIDSD